MLILNRKHGEGIVITDTFSGRKVLLRYYSKKGRFGVTAKLAFEAPPEIVIDREEIALAKETNQPGNVQWRT